MEETGEAQPDGRRRRRVKVRHVFLLLIVAFVVWRNWGLLKSHSEQDQCTFGTGSTALYERLRSEADVYLAKHTKARLPGYSQTSAIGFRQVVFAQLRDFALVRETPTERWAAIHALLRAYGMEFSSNGPREKEKLAHDSVVLSTTYFVQLPKLNWLCPLCYLFPLGQINFHLRNRGDGIYDRINGSFTITRFRLAHSQPFYPNLGINCPGILK